MAQVQTTSRLAREYLWTETNCQLLSVFNLIVSSIPCIKRQSTDREKADRRVNWSRCWTYLNFAYFVGLKLCRTIVMNDTNPTTQLCTHAHTLTRYTSVSWLPRVLNKLSRVEFLMKRHLKSYRIFTCRMASHSVTFHPTQVNTLHRQASTWFTYPRVMEGWVEQSDRLHTKMVYPPTDGHPVKY